MHSNSEVTCVMTKVLNESKTLRLGFSESESVVVDNLSKRLG